MDQPFETSLASFAIGVAVTNRLGGGGLLFFVLVESLLSCRGPHTESRPPMTWRRRARDRLESNGRDPFLIKSITTIISKHPVKTFFLSLTVFHFLCHNHRHLQRRRKAPKLVLGKT